MKLPHKLLVTFLLLAFVCLLTGFWVMYTDSSLKQAQRMYPLNKRTPYIIVKTDGTGAEFESDIPHVYAILRPGEPQSSASLSWRRIGKSNEPIEEYLNEKVYIEGKYYMGKPLLINRVENDRYGFLEEQPVIEIYHLTIAE